MADIKTRNTKKDIKIFDNASTVGDKMKDSYIRTKNNAENLADDGHNSPTEYAENNIRSAVEDVTKDTARGVKNTTKSAYKKGRELYRTHKDVKQAKQSVDSAKQTTKTLQHSVKTTQKTVKTAEQTSKAAIKTSKAAAKTAQEAAKASVKVAKATAQTAKAVAKATIAAIKAIIASAKSLVVAIAAGGWVTIVVIIIICVIALIVSSCFGIFFSSEDTGGSQSMQTVVQEINTEYQTQIETTKNNFDYDVLEMSGSRAVWEEVLSVYAVKTTTDLDIAQEVVTMDETKKAILKEIFWQMNAISSCTETKNETFIIQSDDGNGNIVQTETKVTRTYLYITVTNKSADEMATQFGFTINQKKQLKELLADENRELWNDIIDAFDVY